MKKVFNLQCIIVLCLLTNNVIIAQIKKENLKLGISYGLGSQSRFPFNSKDYSHDVTFYKAIINYTILEKKHWNYELSIEPGYNIVEHQLLNKYFIKPTDGDDYLEKQALYTQKRTIKEYVLNLGFIAKYHVFKTFSGYATGGVGPMISNKSTERLAKGYAFSDIFGLGLCYKMGKAQFDFRYSVRHTSNLQFKKPNNGHNTTNIQFFVLYKL